MNEYEIEEIVAHNLRGDAHPEKQALARMRGVVTRYRTPNFEEE